MVPDPATVPTPKWAADLIRGANSKNKSRGSNERYTLDDLIAAWRASKGRCGVSGLEFDLAIVGDGKARRPYAPSLDRINRHRHYTRDNVRLVTSIANFAMNAWGLDPLIQLCEALVENHKEVPPLIEALPGFPSRDVLRPAVMEFLSDGPLRSRQIEDLLADRFRITDRGLQPGIKYSRWRYKVSWALASLVQDGSIKRIGAERTNDGTGGIYEISAARRDCVLRG